MGYTIFRYVDERLEASERLLDDSYGNARVQARQRVDALMAERVEVIDDNNVVLFRWPKRGFATIVR